MTVFAAASRTSFTASGRVSAFARVSTASGGLGSTSITMTTTTMLTRAGMD